VAPLASRLSMSLLVDGLDDLSLYSLRSLSKIMLRLGNFIDFNLASYLKRFSDFEAMTDDLNLPSNVFLFFFLKLAVEFKNSLTF